MILYNITVIMESEIHSDWLNWMQEKQIPKVLETGYFISHRILRVLESPNEGITFCLQFIVDSNEKLNEFNAKHTGLLEANTPEKFNNKLVIFPTVMEFI
jgi:alpha-amylase/alpha-mannosidase (GH57 family)